MSTALSTRRGHGGRRPRVPRDGLRRRHRRFQLLGRRHRPELHGPGAGCGPSPGIPSAPAPAASDSTSARSTSTTRSPCGVARRGHHALQHLLGPLPPRARRPRRAVANSRTLFHAARHAGVQRIVHVSITHPSITSPVPLLPGQGRGRTGAGRGGRLLRSPPTRHPLRRGRGAAQQHRLAPATAPGVRRRRTGRLPHPTRPRRRPGPPERGRPGPQRADSVTDAVGPERPTFVELVRLIRDAVGSRSLHRPRPRRDHAARWPRPSGSFSATCCSPATSTGPWPPGWPTPSGPATGRVGCRGGSPITRDSLGRHYANEIERHFGRRRGR